MQRLGYYTGTVYGDEIDPNNIQECAIEFAVDVVMTFEGPLSIDGARSKYRHVCGNCQACPESRKGELRMGEHKFNPTAVLAKEGKIAPKKPGIGKREMERRFEAAIREYATSKFYKELENQLTTGTL